MPPSAWFCALLESATDVYFRYARRPRRRFAYVSPSVHTLTGRTPEQFYADSEACVALVADDDRRVLRLMLRARRRTVRVIRIVRHGVLVPIEVQTVSLVRRGRVVAIEGVARLADAGRGRDAENTRAGTHPVEPVQARLATLMYEVHDLLHRVLPPTAATETAPSPRMLQFGAIALDVDRLTVTESGRPVALTSREVLLLRYLLDRPGRIVTRAQLLRDVWDYRYTGDDRTVDVHMSRLRHKLPSLRGRLIGIRNVGYRLEDEQSVTRAIG